MTTMAANDDDVGADALRGAMNLALGPPKDQMLAVGRDAKGCGKFREMGFRLLVDLVLHGRQIHGNVTAVCQAQWFYHVHDVHLGVERLSKPSGALGHEMRFFGEIHSQHDAAVIRHIPPRLPAGRFEATIHRFRYPHKKEEWALSWLVILVVLLVAFGPVMWLLPSKRDRRLAAMRQQARQEGMLVEIRHLPKSDPLPQEQVTAGGRILQPVDELAVYQWPLQRRLQHLPTWRLLRRGKGIEAFSGWSFEIGEKPRHAYLDAALEAVGPVLGSLPEDVLAVACEDRQICAYWLESPANGTAEVVALARNLAAGAQALEALERKIEAEADEGKI